MALSCSPAHSRKDLAIHGMDCPFPVSVSPLGSNTSLHAGLSCSPPHNRRDLALRGIDCPFPASLSPAGSNASLHASVTASLHAPLTASTSLPTYSSSNDFALDRAVLSFRASPVAAASASSSKTGAFPTTFTAPTSPDVAAPTSPGTSDTLLLSGGEEVDAVAEAAAMAPISMARQRRRARNRQSRKDRFRTQPVTIVELLEVDEEQLQLQQQYQQQQKLLTASDTNRSDSRRGSGLTRSLDNLQQHQELQQVAVDIDATPSKVSQQDPAIEEKENSNVTDEKTMFKICQVVC